MLGLVAKAPLGGDVKVKRISGKGALYEIKDNRDHYVYPVLPGIVTEIDGEEVTIDHEKIVEQDITTTYNIDGTIKVREGQQVNQSTALGVTDDEVELFVIKNGNKIDAIDFIGTKFSKGSNLDPLTKARCFFKNLISAPHKTLGTAKEDDPCWELWRKEKQTQGDTTTPEDKDEKTPDNPKTDDQKNLDNQKGLPSGDQKGLPSGDQKGLPSGDKEKSFWDGIAQDVDFEEITESVKKQNLIEEITRIKELLK